MLLSNFGNGVGGGKYGMTYTQYIPLKRCKIMSVRVMIVIVSGV